MKFAFKMKYLIFSTHAEYYADIMQNNGEFYMPRCQNACYNNTLFYYDNVENIECIVIFSTWLQGDSKTDSPPKKSKKKKSDEL